MSDAPDPGTPEALNRGCTCSVIDNHHGKGWRGVAGSFAYDFACPLHNPEPPRDATGVSRKPDRASAPMGRPAGGAARLPEHGEGACETRREA